MIFDSNKMAPWIADILHQANYYNGAYFSSVRVVIYSGTQPSTEAFEAGWSTSYWLNDAGSTGTVASSVLCAYGDIWNRNSSSIPNASLNRAGNLLNLGSGIPVSYYFNAGSATWAVIFPVYNEVRDTQVYQVEFSQLTTPKNFIIAPVGDSLSTAPVQLGTTTISGSAPSLVALGLEINLGA